MKTFNDMKENIDNLNSRLIRGNLTHRDYLEKIFTLLEDAKKFVWREVQQEMIMFEHRPDLNIIQRWDELKEKVSNEISRLSYYREDKV